MPVVPFQQRSDRHRVKVGDVTFSRRSQANLFLELKALERAGKITNLRPHARIPLVVTGVKGPELVDTYTVTFSYTRDGQTVLVDTEFATDVRQLQKRLVKALLGLEVKNVAG